MTEFSNHTLILPADSLLPTAAAAPDYQPLQKAYLTLKRINWAVGQLGISAFVGVGIGLIELLQTPWIITPVAIGWLLMGALYWFDDTLGFRISGYAIREHDLHYRTGWWWRRQRVVPFNRVQHLSIESGLLERKFKLASLSIYTAGSAQADFQISGLSQELAEQLKEIISQKIHAVNPTTYA